MQQPLCHLYFNILLEHLSSESRDLTELVVAAENISQVRKEVKGRRERGGREGREEGREVLELTMFLLSAVF